MWPVKGASCRVAPFSLYLLLCLWPGLLSAQCGKLAGSEAAQVQWVYDGDTVKLADGRKLRLIGLNTPELGRDGEADEPYAQQARQVLQELLGEHNNKVYLRVGEETQDHYGRLLAHLFLADGRNLTEYMLERGLALRIGIAPNLALQDCYTAAEVRARRDRQGLWSSQAVMDARQLSPEAKGFHLLHGKVVKQQAYKKGGRLELAGGLLLRIAQPDWQAMTDERRDWRGQWIEIRGWLHREGERVVMNLKQRGDLVLLPDHRIETKF